MLDFLKALPARSRRMIMVFGVIFLMVLTGAVLSFVVSPWPVLTWQQLQELQVQELPLYLFERGSLEFTLPGENYILFERWLGNTIEPNLTALDFYLICFAIGLIILLALVSALPRFSFYIGSLLATFLIALMGWDSLLIAGIQSRFISIAIVSPFLLALLYFQFFKTGAQLITRLAVFTVICGLLGCLLVGTSTVVQPLRLLAIHTIPGALVITLIFIILVSHQILASFVSLAMASSKTQALRQYLTIALIYLLNLWLAYWDRIGWLDWDYTLPPFLVFAASAFLAVWTIRQRAPIYESIFPADVLLVLFALGVGTLSLGTYGYFISAGNDIVLLSLNDLVLYTHIGYGMMFIFYMASNFIGLFEKNLPIPKVLYKPTTMPYFTYRFAGLVFTLALLFYNNWQAHLNHFTSGFFTAMGDLRFQEPGNEALKYYQRAHLFSPYNQHASTALATLEAWNGNYGKEKGYMIDANRFRPTEFTILNADQVYLLGGNAYEDLKVLRQGKDLHPESGVIKNNLGLSLSRIGMIDSAALYFNEATKDRRSRSSAEMNLFGLKAKQKVPLDSATLHNTSLDPGVRSNVLATANSRGVVLSTTILLPEDSVLNLFSATMLANDVTNQTTRIDTALLTRVLHLAHRPSNAPYKDMILEAAAKACYASGQVNRAISLLQEAIFSGGKPGPANYVLGLMAMDQEKFDVAIGHFYYALLANSRPAALANAVSLAEEGRIDEAIIAWDTISHRKDTTLHEVSESMKRALAAPSSWFKDLTDREKLYYALYQIPLGDSALFNRMIAQITNEDLRARAYLNRAKKHFTKDEGVLAAKQYGHLQGLHLTDTRLFAEIKYFEMRLLASQRRLEELQGIIDQGIVFGPYHTTEEIYFRALQQEAAGDPAAAASYLWLAKNNWYFDEAIVAAASYFKNDTRRAYGILSDALQVNPNAVKILKAYIPTALARGFDQYAANALATLRDVISPEAFKKYVDENQYSGLLMQ